MDTTTILIAVLCGVILLGGIAIAVKMKGGSDESDDELSDQEYGEQD